MKIIKSSTIYAVLAFSAIISGISLNIPIGSINAAISNEQGCSSSNDQPERCTNNGYPDADCRALNAANPNSVFY